MCYHQSDYHKTTPDSGSSLTKCEQGMSKTCQNVIKLGPKSEIQMTLGELTLFLDINSTSNNKV